MEINQESKQQTKNQSRNRNTVSQSSNELKTETTSSNLNQRSEQEMNQAHFILQAKGGVGKSLAASVIAQFLRGRGESVEVVDTDPSNATLFGYKALNVQRLDLMEEIGRASCRERV